MSELRSAIEQYLTVRRALGYKLVLGERLLRLRPPVVEICFWR
jgi:hypothetical protein